MEDGRLASAMERLAVQSTAYVKGLQGMVAPGSLPRSASVDNLAKAVEPKRVKADAPKPDELKYWCMVLGMYECLGEDPTRTALVRAGTKLGEATANGMKAWGAAVRDAGRALERMFACTVKEVTVDKYVGTVKVEMHKLPQGVADAASVRQREVVVRLGVDYAVSAFTAALRVFGRSGEVDVQVDGRVMTINVTYAWF